MVSIKKILICSIFLCASVSNAAEFEVMDMFTVNGITNLKSSASIIVPDTVPSSIWISTSATTSHLYISTAGNVGIGTDNPQAKLNIKGGEFWMFNDGGNSRMIIGDTVDTGQYGYLQWDSANDYYRIETDGSNGLKIKGNNVSIGNIFPSQPLIIGSGSTELFRVTAAGDVGIGITTPKGKLDVRGGVISMGDVHTDHELATTLRVGGSIGVGDLSAAEGGNPDISGHLNVFGKNTAGRMVISRYANLGIGDVLGQITFDGTASSVAEIRGLWGGWSPDRGRLDFLTRASDGLVERITIKEDRVGIGTTSPDANVKLDIAGDLRVQDASSIGNIHYFLASEYVTLWSNVGGGPHDQDVSANVPARAKGAVIKVIVGGGGSCSLVVADRLGNFSSLSHYCHNGFTNYSNSYVGGLIFVPFYTGKTFKWKMKSNSNDPETGILSYATLVGWF